MTVPDDLKCDIVRKCLESQEYGGKISAFISNATVQPIKHVLTKVLSQSDSTELLSEDSNWYFYPSGFCLHVCCRESGMSSSDDSTTTRIGYFSVLEEGKIFVKEWKTIHRVTSTDSMVVFEDCNPFQCMRRFSVYYEPFGDHDDKSSWYQINELTEIV